MRSGVGLGYPQQIGVDRVKTFMITIVLVLLSACASEPALVQLGAKAVPVRDGQPCRADPENRFRVTGSRIYRAYGSVSPYPCKSYSSYAAKRKFQQIFTPQITSGIH